MPQYIFTHGVGASGKIPISEVGQTRWPRFLSPYTTGLLAHNQIEWRCRGIASK